MRSCHPVIMNKRNCDDDDDDDDEWSVKQDCVMNSVEAGVTSNGHLLNNLHFADGTDLKAESPNQL